LFSPETKELSPKFNKLAGIALKLIEDYLKDKSCEETKIFNTIADALGEMYHEEIISA